MSRPSPRVRVAVLVTCGLLAVPASASAQDPNATDLVQTVTRNGETLTMRLHKVPLRGPHFEVKVQNLLGGYDTYAPPGPDRAYLGTVDGRPGAVASGIVADDGDLRGQIAFDRGATWFTDGTTVTGTRGLDAPTLRWPSTTTLSPGLADGRMRAWDLGVDVTSGYYLNAGRGGSSPAKTLEQVEYSLSNVRATYMPDAETMPRLGRVVVRAVAARDPFAPGGTTAGLGAFRDEWRANQTDAVRDEALVVDAGGGGVAYRVAFSPDYAYARSGSDDDGPFDVVTRHEIGHNWNVGDNESENAEGATIMNGNGYARFSGPELQTMLTSRKARLDVLDDLGRWSSTGLPPYAALDLADDVAPSATTTVDVLANDHDANAQALTLTGVDATTKAGGTARIADGKVRYTAPSGAYGLDSFGYTISDACGQTATGVVLARASGTAATATSAGVATTGTTGTASADAGRTTCAADGGGTGGGGTAGTGGPSGSGGAGGSGGGTAAPGTVTAELLAVRTTRAARRSGGVLVWRCGQARPSRPALVVAQGRRASGRVFVRGGSGKVCTSTRTGGRPRVTSVRRYVAPTGWVARSPRPKPVTATRRGSFLRIALGTTRGVLATDRRVALHLTVRSPRRSGALRIARCGTAQPRRATLRFTRGRSASTLVLVANPRARDLCVSVPRGVRVTAELQARLPRAR